MKRRSKAPGPDAGEPLESRAQREAEEREWLELLARAKAALAAEEAEWQALRASTQELRASEEREWQEQLSRARAA